MAIPTYLRELHSSLDSRLRPEDVLAIIVRGRPSALPEKWRVAFREAPGVARATTAPGHLCRAILPSQSALSAS
jgi:hypothetical protein